MNRQARILSFDEARSKSGATANGRARTRRPDQGQRARGAYGRDRNSSALLSYLSDDDFDSPYDDFDEVGKRASKQRRKRAAKAKAAGRAASQARGARAGRGRNHRSAESVRVAAAAGTSGGAQAGSGSRAVRRTSSSIPGEVGAYQPSTSRNVAGAAHRSRRADIAATAQDARRGGAAAVPAAADDADTEDEEFSGEITAADRRAARRRAKSKQKAKAKAEQQFRRQFGDDSGASSEGGTRAAVYKGEMGAKQRRASRMQEKASPAMSIKGAVSGFSLKGLLQSRRFVICSAVAVCLIAAGVFLYSPLKNYYCNVREHDRLALEYQAVTDRNDKLQSEVNSLQTDDGVKARAHEQLGWVEKGEESANVTGLNLEDSSSDGEVVVANVSSDSIKAPATWYSPLLDRVFGYEKGQ